MTERRTKAEMVAAYEARGLRLHNKSGELHGACPNCGGDPAKPSDRFWLKADGRFGCRGCQPGADNPDAFKAIMAALFPDDAKGELSMYAPNDREAVAFPAGDLPEGVTVAETPELPPEEYGVTLAEWWEMLGIEPVSELRITQDTCYIPELKRKVQAVRIPYPNEDGEEIGAKLRVQTKGTDKYRYERGSKAMLYGQPWLDFARSKGRVVVAEGETCQIISTMCARVPCIAPPGCGQAKTITAELAEGIAVWLVIQEAGEAGAKFPQAIADRLKEIGSPGVVRVVKLPGGKDIKELREDDPARFENRYKRALLEARSIRAPKIKLHFASDIVRTAYPPPRWILPGLIPEGLTLLYAAPKVGKSFFSLQVAGAVARGRPLWGFEPEQGEVLLIDLEQPVGEAMKGRLVRHGAEEDGYQTVIADEWPAIGAGGVRELEIVLEERPALRLVVVDVWSNIKPASTGRGNAYDVEYPAVRRLRDVLLRRHAGMILVHHDRKTPGGGITSQASGSKALSGAPNALLWLKRDVGNPIGELEATGRDIEDQKYEAEFHHRAWSLTKTYPVERQAGINTGWGGRDQS